MVFLKTTLILLGIVLINLKEIFVSNSDDTLLEKFHQNVYKLRNLRADVISRNMKFVNKYEVKTFKFNRTQTAFNITMSYNCDTADKIDFLVQMYKRTSNNDYGLFPVRMRLNYCKYFNKNVFGLLGVLNCGNVTGCIFKKGAVYHICNFVIDATKFPPLVPIGEFKTEIIAMFGEEEVAVTHAYAEVYLPIKIP